MKDTQGLTRGGEAFGARVERLDTVDSTNTYLKRKAAGGAPHGWVVLAEEQTGGRGRMGRSFQSARGKGLYLSVLLRPGVQPAEAPRLTAWTAVAVSRAVEACTGLCPDIKWTNDLQLEGKKLCGILTEMEVTPSGELDWVIVGIGINVGQQREDFEGEVAGIATSLAMHLPRPPAVEELARHVIRELGYMAEAFPGKKEEYLEEYRRRCVTVGKPVQVLAPGKSRRGFALGVDEDFCLTVDFEDGGVETVGSGEVSVRTEFAASAES